MTLHHISESFLPWGSCQRFNSGGSLFVFVLSASIQEVNLCPPRDYVSTNHFMWNERSSLNSQFTDFLYQQGSGAVLSFCAIFKAARRLKFQSSSCSPQVYEWLPFSYFTSMWGFVVQVVFSLLMFWVYEYECDGKEEQGTYISWSKMVNSKSASTPTAAGILQRAAIVLNSLILFSVSQIVIVSNLPFLNVAIKLMKNKWTKHYRREDTDPVDT